MGEIHVNSRKYDIVGTMSLERIHVRKGVVCVALPINALWCHVQRVVRIAAFFIKVYDDSRSPSTRGSGYFGRLDAVYVFVERQLWVQTSEESLCQTQRTEVDLDLMSRRERCLVKDVSTEASWPRTRKSSNQSRQVQSCLNSSDFPPTGLGFAPKL